MPVTSSIAIAGITEATILRYFETFNAGDFNATAALFAPEGELHPPFESAIVGTEAIASYLNVEAQGMTLNPRQGIARELDDRTAEIQVAGSAQTPLFGVNIAWNFLLNPQQEILAVRIKLLASPQELLNLRQYSKVASDERSETSS